jgi:CDGSH-type Zn-finger protein
MKQRFKDLAIKAGINKPTDFYLLRHSSIVLDKKDRVDPEFAAKRHNHSIKYYSERYGRLSEDDIADIVSQTYGGKQLVTKIKETNIVCRCGMINKATSEFCAGCSMPLNLNTALNQNKQFEEMQKQLSDIKKIMELKITKKGKKIRDLGDGRIVELSNKFKDISDEKLKQSLLYTKLHPELQKKKK